MASWVYMSAALIHHTIGCSTGFIGMYFGMPEVSRFALVVEAGGECFLHFIQMFLTKFFPQSLGTEPWLTFPGSLWALMATHHVIGSLGFIVDTFVYPCVNWPEVQRLIFYLLLSAWPSLVDTLIKPFGNVYTPCFAARLNAFTIVPISFFIHVWTHFVKYPFLALASYRKVHALIGVGVANYVVAPLLITFQLYTIGMFIISLVDLVGVGKMLLSGSPEEDVLRQVSRSKSALTLHVPGTHSLMRKRVVKLKAVAKFVMLQKRAEKREGLDNLLLG